MTLNGGVLFSIEIGVASQGVDVASLRGRIPISNDDTELFPTPLSTSPSELWVPQFVFLYFVLSPFLSCSASRILIISISYSFLLCLRSKWINEH